MWFKQFVLFGMGFLFIGNLVSAQGQHTMFAGKTIRQIHIETLDPYGYSINDTTHIAQNFLFRTGNKWHVKTRANIIRNLLLFNQNQSLDALVIKESERLVRSMNFVHDVSFVVAETEKNSDSVDVFIRVLDRWSIIPLGSITSLGTSIDLIEKNFLGYGHEIQTLFNRDLNRKKNSYAATYSIPNIGNTYIGSQLHYAFDDYKNFNRSLLVERPFFSPLTKWAAGINLIQEHHNDTILTPILHYLPQQFKVNVYNFWGGYAMPLIHDHPKHNRSTNFITTVRYLRVHYSEKPIETSGSQNYYSNENYYLTSFGLSKRKYVQDHYIFRFGIIEDVPIGRVISITAGLQQRNNAIRDYLGARVSFGNYYPWGYLSTNLEYGAFSILTHTEQGVVKAGATYFTNLFNIEQWKFRQFVKPQITIGLNRFLTDSLTINDGYGLDGFNSPTLFGTNRLLLTLQTQAYAPGSILGFNFGPYFIWSMGMLGNTENKLINSKLYSQIGLGVLIRNESLVLITLQLSVAYYPEIPGKGENLFKFNAFKTADFGFQDFQIGQPATVEFR